jgi:hypothetical protein
MPPVSIALSKWKMLLIIGGALLFVVAGVVFFNMDPAEIEARRRWNSPWLVHGVGLLAMAMGAAGVLGVGRKLFDGRPGLVLDDRGLTDNSSLFAAGFVPWSEITGVSVRAVHGSNQKILYVLLADPERFIAKFGPLRRLAMRAGMKMGSPVGITSGTLQVGFDEMVALVERHFEASKSR